MTRRNSVKLNPVWLAIAFAFAGWVAVRAQDTQHTFSASQSVPAAQGKVFVDRGEDGNSNVIVEVEHLAQPAELARPGQTYVVWVQPVQTGSQAGVVSSAPAAATANPQNAGALRVDKDLKGSLNTVVPFPDFALFITAEPGPSVTQPTGERLMWTEAVRP